MIAQIEFIKIVRIENERRQVRLGLTILQPPRITASSLRNHTLFSPTLPCTHPEIFFNFLENRSL
eukprot:COSAG06_NODE_34784_length_469_cov_1.072973_2_plen_64_part_01